MNDANSTTTTATTTEYVITYFEFRARAEVIKLICEEGGLSYRVNLISDYPNWPCLILEPPYTKCF